MAGRKGWSRQELLVAFGLYTRMPFGRLHSRNPEIVEYAGLLGRTPSALAMKLTNIASLDPAIISTGRKGLFKASLADRGMWEFMESSWDEFALESEEAMLLITGKKFESSDHYFDAGEANDYTGLDKEVTLRARVGQSFFRKSVLSAYNNKCCITGLSSPKLLVASHIVPWRADIKNRLNPRNGLSLSVLHDKAFDLGIITIDADMKVRVCSIMSYRSDEFFDVSIRSYHGVEIKAPDKFYPSEDFLSYHRDNVFLG